MFSRGSIVRSVRRRLPIGRVVTGHDSRLPFVARRPTINPIMPVGDMPGAAAFYERLGFEVEMYDHGYAWVKHCGWEFLHLRRLDGFDASTNEASAYVHVTDVDAWHAGMRRDAEAGEVGEIRDEPWGMREFSVTDPAGNLARIGQRTGERTG